MSVPPITPALALVSVGFQLRLSQIRGRRDALPDGGSLLHQRVDALVGALAFIGGSFVSDLENTLHSVEIVVVSVPVVGVPVGHPPRG